MEIQPRLYFVFNGSNTCHVTVTVLLSSKMVGVTAADVSCCCLTELPDSVYEGCSLICCMTRRRRALFAC